MSGNVMAGRHTKDDQTRKFLEEACALIELGNSVESYRQGQTKLCKPCAYDRQVDSSKVKGRAIEAGCGNTSKDGVAKLKSEARRQASRRYGPTLDNLVAQSIRTSIDSKVCTSNLKRISRHKLQNKLSKKDEDKKDMNEDKSNNTQIRHRSTENRKSCRISERKIRKQVLASNFDMANFMQLYPLKDQIRHDNLSKVLTILLSKTNVSKSSLSTWKSFSSFTDTHILNQNSAKRGTYKLGKALGVNEAEPNKPDVKKPSLHLSVNLRVKPNSNTVNLQIKSRNGSCKTDCSELDTLRLRLPLKCPSSANEKLINKLSETLNSSFAERSATTPSAQTSDDQKLQNHQVFAAPYAKTQAVYNMYDVALMHQPREVKGIKSHLYFNFNIGRQPTPAQRYMDSDGTSTINSQPSTKRGSQVLYKSKVNLNRGLTSMQQSFTLDRRDRKSSNETESDVYSRLCRCGNLSEPVVCSDTQQSGSVCSPCCQADLARGKEQTPLPDDLMERYALLCHRTKQRILNRVGISAEDARSMIFSPRVFMHKLYEKYKNITNKVEAQQKSVGSCTCSPFIDTEQVSVQEEIVNPECSLLKRCFGQLIFSNKCVVCSENKRIGTDYRPLKPYECEPGECVEKSPGLFACFKKLCKRKPVDQEKLKGKKKEKEKKKSKKDREKKRARRKKEKERKNRLKGKKRGTGFLTSIFKKPDEDDDRQWLLNDYDYEDKKRKKQGGVEKGKGSGTSELENKAKKTLAVGRRGYRRMTRRIRERYYRNKKLAEEQKGRYACDFYLMSLRNKPCLWVYYLCPFFYPYCLQLVNAWRQVSDLLLFFVAIVVWSPCILFAELIKVLACNMWVTA